MTDTYLIGTRVTKIMGVRLSGVVIAPFYWRESTDGTFREPRSDYVPVQWDDGTKGYIWKYHIEGEKK